MWHSEINILNEIFIDILNFSTVSLPVLRLWASINVSISSSPTSTSLPECSVSSKSKSLVLNFANKFWHLCTFKTSSPCVPHNFLWPKICFIGNLWQILLSKLMESLIYGIKNTLIYWPIWLSTRIVMATVSFLFNIFSWNNEKVILICFNLIYWTSFIWITRFSEHFGRVWWTPNW